MRAIGKENTWFSFKGIRNDEVGVYMLSMPTRPHPARKGRVIDIPGADGEMWQDEGGYKRIIIPIRLITLGNANIDGVNLWLSGEGDLIFGDEPERLYHARITKEFSRSNRSQRLRGQEFTVSFDCEPYRYKVGDMFETPGYALSHPSSGMLVPAYNEGTAAAWPIFEVSTNGSGGTITINGKTLIIDGSPNTICIDCGAKFAYSINEDGTFAAASMYVGGDWPSLLPGDNTVAIAPAAVTGSRITVSMRVRWRWL